MNKFNTTESSIFISSLCSLLPKDLTTQKSLSLLVLVLCRVAVVKRLPVHHHSADYIFWSFGIVGFILSYFENKVLLKPVLGAWRPVLHISLLVMNRLIRQSRKENPQKLTQLSSRSHIRHLVGKRTAQKDTIIDSTSDSQVNSNFPNRWSPASLTFNNYFYLFLYLYIT